MFIASPLMINIKVGVKPVPISTKISSNGISGNQHCLLGVHMVGLEDFLMRLVLILKMRLLFGLAMIFWIVSLHFTPHYTLLT